MTEVAARGGVSASSAERARLGLRCTRCEKKTETDEVEVCGAWRRSGSGSAHLVGQPQHSEPPPPWPSSPLRWRPSWRRAAPSGRSTPSGCSTGGPAWG